MRLGNASHLGPEVEAKICKRLGLAVTPVASQVIQRDLHAQYLSSLALIAATLERIAVEIRHLQRTEVREAEEPFYGEQRGSSVMPHKRNPVTCEQVSGLARLVRSNMLAAYENVALWHERDISHSSVERVILPDSTILVDYMLAKMTTIIGEMRVFPERMLRNQTHAWPGVLGSAIARPRREGHASRRSLQSRPGKRDDRMGKRFELPPSGSRRSANYKIYGCRRTRAHFSICSDSFVVWTPFSIGSSAPIPRAKNPRSESRPQSWGKLRFESSSTNPANLLVESISDNSGKRCK